MVVGGAIYLFASAILGYVAYTALIIAAHCRSIVLLPALAASLAGATNTNGAARQPPSALSLETMQNDIYATRDAIPVSL